MHIKQLVINGFRSFRNQGEIEPFSPGHNVIVGRNGSGKSNFFDAIQFVLLAPRFVNLRQEDRQHLLHEGAGSGVLAAYVEIVFDNSDGRFPVETDEVILRRSVGFKKDEFFLNRKRVQKSEVSSLLESAGFSKSNPYYIVQQGKVANICVMKDKDRLNLLKEVAGTTVYEERRAESLKIMQETKTKQEQITEILTFIEERLSELEKEKNELKAYELLDKHRKALEYTMYDKELTKYTEQLSQIEVTREEERQRHQEVYAQYRELQDAIQQQDELLASLRAGMDRLAGKRTKKSTELTELRGNKSALETALTELQTSRSHVGSDRASLEADLEETRLAMASVEAQLAQIEPEYEGLQTTRTEVVRELEAAKHRVDELYAKQGRGKQFASVKERDAFLGEQLDQLSAQLQSKEAMLRALTSEVDTETSRVAKEASQYQKAVEENKNKAAKIDAVGGQIHAKLVVRNDLQERRKSVWREQEGLNEKLIEVRQDAEKAKKSLNSSLPKHIAQGLAAVAKIAEERKLTGYFGPVIDNIGLKNDAFRTCVEVAAGNALFHVIVDTDKTAAILIKELERRKAGRITFLPLNRIRNDPVNYPVSNDVRPLMDVALVFEPQFEPAIRQVFGKKLLARDLEVAAHFSKSSQLDAITKDGDLVNRKGGFEGGYYDERESRISAVMKIRGTSGQLENLSAQESALKKMSDELEASIDETLRELQDLEREKEALRRSSEQMSLELANRKKQIDSVQEALEVRARKAAQLGQDVAQTAHQAEVYRAEQGTPLQGKLSEAERGELRQLGERDKELYERLDGAEKQLVEVSRRRDGLRAELVTNLAKRLTETQDRLQTIGLKSDASYKNEISDVKDQITLASAAIAKLVADVDEMDGAVEQKKAELEGLERAVGEQRLAEVAGVKAIDEAAQMQDKLLSKRSLLQENIQQKQRLIRELGTLPRKELEEFRTYSEKQLLRKLKEVNEELKKYASVNRKALDQYVSFTEQRESLIERSAELGKDSEAINQLLTGLDHQKEEAILRTFEDVRAHFTEVFSELVPGGEGRLVMRTSLDEAAAAAEGEEDVNEEAEAGEKAVTTAEQQMSQFLGVQIKVSFAGSGQQYDMQQLSGGQKALVALALIFAIQRSDPAPFYLFDEIDQALDSNYRAGVARLIKKQAESTEAPAQFITTTFRPELVNVADKCYGISLQHKVSNIIPLDKSDAIKFVIDLLHEEEAVGKVSAVPSFSRAQRQRDAAEQLEDYQQTAAPEQHDTYENEEEGEGGDNEGDISSSDEGGEQPRRQPQTKSSGRTGSKKTTAAPKQPSKKKSRVQ